MNHAQQKTITYPGAAQKVRKTRAESSLRSGVYPLLQHF